MSDHTISFYQLFFVCKFIFWRLQDISPIYLLITTHTLDSINPTIRFNMGIVILIDYIFNWFCRVSIYFYFKVVFQFFLMMFVVEFLDKIIYLCNKLSLEKLWLEILGKYLYLWILKAFISAHCIKDLGYWSCVKKFSI